MLKALYEHTKPTRGSKYSVGVDLYAREDVVIGVGETKMIPLGVCIDLDGWLEYNDDRFQKGIYGSTLGFIDSEFDEEAFEEFKGSHYLQLEPRSSLRAKGLIAGTGIIDLDYKDEICIVFHNLLTFKAIVKWIFSFGRSKSVFKIEKGDKIAQILLKEHKTYLMGVDTQEERVGGFGSTGNR